MTAEDTRPAVYVLSDSLGETADAVAKAALSQFEEETFHVIRLPKVTSRGQLQGLVRGACVDRCAFLYTLAAPRLRAEMVAISAALDILAIDIMGPAIEALHTVSGIEPEWAAGAMRRTDRGYFERVEALEFAVKHDDGRLAEELDQAEIVLIGVSRSSKTPLAMYLAFKGYKVANVPLVPEVPPPHELYAVDPRRVFGLTTSAEVLVDVRHQRLAEIGPWARAYFDRERIERELEEARALMRQLGCMVVSTEARAIEETAQEILRFYEEAYGGERSRTDEHGDHTAAPAPPPRSHRHRLQREGD